MSKAIKNGDLTTVEKLLADHLDPNTRIPGSPLHYTPLFLSVMENQSSITSTLLKAGADPAMEDDNGDLVITCAADQEHIAQAKLLIAHGVSIDSRNSNGITALMREAPYAKEADIQAKIDLGASVDLLDPQGRSSLIIAVSSGNLEAVRVLLKAGAATNIVDQEGQSALMKLFSGEIYNDESESAAEIVELLLKAGADVNIRDKEGQSALLLALKRSSPTKDKTLRRLLAANPDVKSKDTDGRDALFYSEMTGKRASISELLVKMGADIRTTDNSGRDILMIAAGNRDLSRVKALLARGLDATRQDISGFTAVHAVIAPGYRWNLSEKEIGIIDNRSVEILKLLENHGASLLATDSDGDTPLHLAAQRNLPLVTDFLLSRKVPANARNLEGKTPLHVAAMEGSDVVLKSLIRICKQIDARDSNGGTALMDAIANDSTESFVLLQKAGADVNASDKNNQSALSMALTANKIDMVAFLLEHGADPKGVRQPEIELLRSARMFHIRPVSTEDYAYIIAFLCDLVRDLNRRDADQITTLMWVAASNNREALDAVLRGKPDLQARSPDGRTALMWAACTQATATYDALLAAGADETLTDASGRSAKDWLSWSRSGQSKHPGSLTKDQSTLHERLTIRWQKELTDFLAKGTWDAADHIAGSSPLHMAATLGDMKALETLLKLGAPVDQVLDDQSTPLMEAASSGQLESVKFLIAHGADPSRRDVDKNRAIDLAARLGHAEIANFLLHQKDSLTDDESILLETLIEHGDKDMLKEFLKSGVSIPAPAFRLRMEDEQRFASFERPMIAASVHPDVAILKILSDFPAATGMDSPALLALALHQAAESGKEDNVRFLVEEKKVDVNSLMADAFGGVTRLAMPPSVEGHEKFLDNYSALSRALECEHLEIVRYLVGHGAIVRGRTRSGLQPLSFAIQHHQHEMLKFLLENKASTALIDMDGLTALHVAADANDELAVKLLLENGAITTAQSASGLTPLDLAHKAKADRVIPLLTPPSGKQK